MELVELIEHPEQLDRDTLYELRSLLALYPYFQTARLLMLQNLYLLHDPSFDEELRRAAIYITDRRVLFQMIEAAHYRIAPQKEAGGKPAARSKEEQDSRTLSLIDDFLDSLPREDQSPAVKQRRKPTPADAAVDYVAYLLESEGYDDLLHEGEAPLLKGHTLIDTFIENDKGKRRLAENPVLRPELEDTAEEEPAGQPEQDAADAAPDEGVADEGYYTEALARIFIKQGRYAKALDIIRQLDSQNPGKNAYFADQMRFLGKLIINNNKKSN